MEQLSEEELLSLSSQQVSVCLQLPDGARLMDNFPVSSSLGSVLDHWQEKLWYKEEGEEPVMVYMMEVVGRKEMEKLTLKTLGLDKNKGIFKFFFKNPEQLRVQTNVYDIKEKEERVPKLNVTTVVEGEGFDKERVESHEWLKKDDDFKSATAAVAAEEEVSLVPKDIQCEFCVDKLPAAAFLPCCKAPICDACSLNMHMLIEDDLKCCLCSEDISQIEMNDKSIEVMSLGVENVGYKIMQKMGYKPHQGLGKYNQGIKTPIKEFQNTGRRGFGWSLEAIKVDITEDDEDVGTEIISTILPEVYDEVISSKDDEVTEATTLEDLDSILQEDDLLRETKAPGIQEVSVSTKVSDIVELYWTQSNHNVELWCYIPNILLNEECVDVDITDSREIVIKIDGVVKVSGELQSKVIMWTWNIVKGQLKINMKKDEEANWNGHVPIVKNIEDTNYMNPGGGNSKHNEVKEEDESDLNNMYSKVDKSSDNLGARPKQRSPLPSSHGDVVGYSKYEVKRSQAVGQPQSRHNVDATNQYATANKPISKSNDNLGARPKQRSPRPSGHGDVVDYSEYEVKRSQAVGQPPLFNMARSYHDPQYETLPPYTEFKLSRSRHNTNQLLNLNVETHANYPTKTSDNVQNNKALVKTLASLTNDPAPTPFVPNRDVSPCVEVRKSTDSTLMESLKAQGFHECHSKFGSEDIRLKPSSEKPDKIKYLVKEDDQFYELRSDKYSKVRLIFNSKASLRLNVSLTEHVKNLNDLRV